MRAIGRDSTSRHLAKPGELVISRRSSYRRVTADSLLPRGCQPSPHASRLHVQDRPMQLDEVSSSTQNEALLDLVGELLVPSSAHVQANLCVGMTQYIVLIHHAFRFRSELSRSMHATLKKL
jgi:hypothetical protein